MLGLDVETAARLALQQRARVFFVVAVHGVLHADGELFVAREVLLDASVELALFNFVQGACELLVRALSIPVPNKGLARLFDDSVLDGVL